jgi:LuxR family transcriptional regulator, maltose regulon positive regulatory protein
LFSLSAHSAQILALPHRESTILAPGKAILTTKPRAAKGHVARTNQPIEICCLGRFSLRKRGDPASIFLQVNSRPSALLQLLIVASGQGCERSEAEIKLWPRAQTDLSDSALDTTLYRLRKLLGDQQAVLVENGLIRLNERQVSVDAWRFAAEAGALCADLQLPTRDAQHEAIALRCKRLFELYQGPFFAQDLKSPGVAQLRDALQSKFLRSVKFAGRYWQAAQKWEQAMQLYESALEIDNLAEELHRELMRCHLARREFSDVVRVFRRCRELLLMVMGVAPSEATEMIYRQALAGQVRL